MRWAAAAFFRHWCFIFSSSEIGAFLLQAINILVFFLSPRVDRVWSLVQGEHFYPKYRERIDLAINLTTVVATEADMELTQAQFIYFAANTDIVVNYVFINSIVVNSILTAIDFLG